MHPIDLDAPVSRQSWDWLAELGSRLNVIVEVLDSNDTPVCPVGLQLEAVLIRQMVTSDSALRAVLPTAAHSKTPVSVTVDGFQATWMRLASGNMLLIARVIDPYHSIDECRDDLELIGGWLAGAIEASLAQPGAITVEGYRLESFRRILRDAAARGPLRKLVGAFVEALSVWDDVRVRVYVAGADGGFVEYASSTAPSPLSGGRALDDAIVPQRGRIARVTRGDVDRIGVLADPGDVAVLRIVVGTAADWVLVFSGMISDYVLVRLRVYSDVFRESLGDVLAAATSRVVAEVGRRQVASNESLALVAQTALNELRVAIGAGRSALALSTAAGRQEFAIGDSELLELRDVSAHNRLVVQSSDAGSIMTVVMDREHAPFTAFEREVAEAGSAAMHPWIDAALHRSDDIERRRNFRPVDTAFDQLATAAVSSGLHASVIVLTIDETSIRPGLLPAWVARIRAQLRGGDRAGMLSDREIAVLLCGTSADQAVVVSGRLKEMAESRHDAHSAFRPSIGMTTRVPDTPFVGSLVGAARASAAAAARG